MDEDAPFESTRRRRFPIVTVVLMAASVVSVLIPTFTDLDVPYVGTGGTRMGAVFVVASVALGLAGSLAAMFYRRIELGARVGWAVLSGATGFVAVWAAFVLITLFYGP